MPDNAGELASALYRRGTKCPMCQTQDWGVLETPWNLASVDGVVSAHLLRAYCRSCGFVAWFQRHVPESAVELKRRENARATISPSGT
jgi:Zn ribbon nucleic-acid-binding protein